jgi:hypothetical protein
MRRRQQFGTGGTKVGLKAGTRRLTLRLEMLVRRNIPLIRFA